MGGEKVTVLPHRSDVVRLARNMGIELPAPIISQYDWPGGTPFETQQKTAAMMTTNPRGYVLNGMGTGKTRAAIWAWHYLRGNHEAGKLLVVAPLSTLQFTWAREFFQTLPHVHVAVLHGTRAKREKLLHSEADVFIINHDGLAVIEPMLKDFPEIDTMVLDECSVYRNHAAKRTKLVRKVAKDMKWCWGMTGSPTPNAPTDAWAQCTILTPDRVPSSFTRFRDQTMVKLTQFMYAPKDTALDTVHRAMQPSVRFTLDDVVELPDVIERTQEVAMGAKQAKVYGAMEKHAFAAFEQKEITAMNAGVVLNKLLQIASGYVYAGSGDERSTVALDNQERIEALVDIIEASDQKVLVFVPFKHALAGISEALTSQGIEHAVVSGDVSPRDRGDIFTAFQQSSKYKVIAAHPATMSHGLTLTAASTIVWFAPITSLETFEQANARIRRVGQRHKQQVIMLQSTKVERRIYSRLRQKQNVQNELLSMFAGGFEE